MKSKRQERILEIISKNNIETQEELIETLRNEGIEITQATASRDIRQLKLLKVAVEGNYRYVAPMSNSKSSDRYNDALFSSIRDVISSVNDVVVRTNPGLAQAIAAGIDSLGIPSIIGCVAGDDTIILVTSSVDETDAVKDKIKSLIKK